MYSYIEGTVTEISPRGYIVIDNRGFGILVYTPNPYSFEIDSFVRVYVYHQVKEDVFCFYGFKDKRNRDFFLKLIGVTGIGPKTALSLLSCDDLELLIAAIDSGNARYLTKFPGIGEKTAQQIVLDIRGKIDIEEFNPVSNDKYKDVIDALVALGYRKSDALKVSRTLDSQKSVENMIKDALLILLR